MAFDMVETENTKKARACLAEHCSDTIVLAHISELKHVSLSGPVTYLGAVERSSDTITVYLSDKYPEESFVHELLHIILNYEGFPDVSVNENLLWKLGLTDQQSIRKVSYLQSQLSSTIDHPELFRRIESEYDLDLHKCYRLQVEQKTERLSKMPNHVTKDVFVMQQNILDGLDYYLWNTYSDKLQKQFRLRFQSAYQSCRALHKKLSKIGMKTPSQVKQAGREIIGHIVNYGERNGLDPDHNNYWKCLLV